MPKPALNVKSFLCSAQIEVRVRETINDYPWAANKAVRHKSSPGTTEVFEVDQRVPVRGSQALTELCMAHPMLGAHGSVVLTSTALFLPPLNSTCSSHQQNKQVNKGGDFLCRNIMKARSGREEISVCLVTYTE